MNITVEIKCPELAAAIETLAAAMGNRQLALAPTTEPVESTAPEKPAKPARAAGKKETAAPTSEPETATDDGEKGTEQTAAPDTSGDASASDGEAISYDVVKKAVMDLALAKGRAAVVDLLTEFKVPDGKKADAIPEDQWPAFVARAAEIMS